MKRLARSSRVAAAALALALITFLPARDALPAHAAQTKQPAADLVVGVVDAPDPVAPGRVLTYRIGLQNRGGRPARDVVVTTAVPPGTTFEALTAPQGWTPSAPEPGSSGDVSFAIPALPHAPIAVFTLSVRVAAEALEGSVVANSVLVTSATADANPDNNAATAETRVATAPPPVADLKLEVSPTPASTGGMVVALLVLTNDGPQAATDVTIRASLPPGTVFRQAATSRGEVSGPPAGEPGEIVATIVVMPKRGPVIVTVVFEVTAAPGTLLPVQAEVTASSIDPDPSDNVASGTLRVEEPGPPADLSVSLADSPDPARTASLLTYTATVRNAGPVPAREVSAVVPIPRGARFARAMSDRGETRTPPPGATGAVLWRLGLVPAGGEATLRVDLVVVANGGPPLANWAVVTSNSSDQNLDDNTAFAATRVQSAGEVFVHWEPPDPPEGGALPPPKNLATSDSSGMPETAIGRKADGPAPAGQSSSTVVGYNVYRGNSPNPPPTEENLFATVPPSTTVVSAPVAPGGSFFTVTAEYTDGESGASNSDGAGDAPGAEITKVKMSTKINATGSGFTDDVTVLLDGVPFVSASKVKKGATKVVQKGTLLTGQTVEEYTSSGGTFLIVFRNSDGGTTVWEYEK